MKRDRLEQILVDIDENWGKLRESSLLYYDEENDLKLIRNYYRHFNFQMENSKKNFRLLHNIVKKTHTNRLPYFISKDQYLYTWVELQPSGFVKSIYSGEENHPADLIKQDYEVHKLHAEWKRAQLLNENSPLTVPENLKFNAEHVVPQSWFAGREPMKGDLHHLFACEPRCNATRSNYAYHDFPNYEPESPNEQIRNHCGVASLDLFEPEYGKGTVARAMLYFMLRYPEGIRKSFRRKIDFNLLRSWNKQFPPNLYEKHRNQAIHQIQGNRNPFIDFPHLINELYFPLRW